MKGPVLLPRALGKAAQHVASLPYSANPRRPAPWRAMQIVCGHLRLSRHTAKMPAEAHLHTTREQAQDVEHSTGDFHELIIKQGVWCIWAWGGGHGRPEGAQVHEQKRPQPPICATSHSRIEVFKKSWAVYQAAVEKDLLFHASMFAAFRGYLAQRWLGRPLDLLDLGCGDGSRPAQARAAAADGCGGLKQAAARHCELPRHRLLRMLPAPYVA